MRKILHYKLALITLTFFFNTAQSQPDRFSYAVTALHKGGTEWIALRKLDTRTGEFGGTLLKMADSSVAAIAYDRKSNRIYYVPMNKDQLRFVNLSTMTTYGVRDQFFSKAGNYAFQTASPITRLVIAADDYGYTITNDGNHLIRFSTTGTPTLTDLGDLVDDPLNKEMTIHNPCANAGGDMIADDAGSLYLISASNRVFKVNIATRLTTFLATISGLPAQFTTNGAAVDDNGKLIVCSSMYTNAYFVVDPATWNALPSQASQQIYASADLANSNVLLTKSPAAAVLLINKSPEAPSKVKVFPDPVLYNEVSIQLNELPPGNYTIQLTNVLGRKVIQQKAIITGPTQTEIMYIPSYTAQGFYFIRILNEKNIVVGTQKLAVARKW